MFSRAAKSVVNNLRQRKCYVTDESIKVRVIGAAEEIGQTLSHYAKTGPKINGSSISNSGPKSHLMISAEQSQNVKASQAQKIQDPRTESYPQKSQLKNNSVVSYFANRELDIEKTVTELRDKELKLSPKNDVKKQVENSAQREITDFPLSKEKIPGQMWTLSGIAAVQHDSSASQWRQLSQTRSEGLPYTPPRNAELRISRIPKVTSEAITAEKLWLGDPDCGECPPDRPLRGPCHPPDGPCVPLRKPGYPAKPKPAKKDFCFNCPPKRPCNLNKCPPDSCDGTCGKADFRRRNLLKLNSESQASSDMRSTVDNQTVRFLDTSMGNGNQLHHIQMNNLQEMQQQFCLSSDASKSSKENPRHSSSGPNLPKIQTFVEEAELLYQKYTAIPKAEGTCPKIVSPKCPFRTKCPECLKLVKSEAGEVSDENIVLKSQCLLSSKAEKTLKKFAFSLTIRFLGTSTWIGNRSHHNQPNKHCRMQRQFFSTCDGSKSSKKKLSDDKKCSDKPKPPEPPSRPKPPQCKTPETAKAPKVVYQKCPALPKLPKLPKCPKVLEFIPTCPPLPKLPKLPKCPECPKLAKPKVKPKKAAKKCASDCHADKPVSVCKESSTVKNFNDHPKSSSSCSTAPDKMDGKISKKKGLWDKIRNATKREMSTYTFNNANLFKTSSLENQKRHLWTCSISCSAFSSKTDPPSSDSNQPWKLRKCKTVEEVCGEVVDPKLKALECKPMGCPKNCDTPCYPEKPRCAEVRKPPEKKSERDKISAKKMSDYSETNKNVQCTSSMVKPVAKIECKKTECVQIKLLAAGPCPASQISLNDKGNNASSHPLPKPPAPPVQFCRCAPPPKLHPGSCPCSEEVENLTRILTEPCPQKSKYSCPENPVYYCPSIKDCEKNDKVCQDKKKKTKP